MEDMLQVYDEHEILAEDDHDKAFLKVGSQE